MIAVVQLENALTGLIHLDFRFNPIGSIEVVESLELFRRSTLKRIDALKIELRELIGHRFAGQSLWINFVTSDWGSEFEKLRDRSCEMGLAVNEAHFFYASLIAEADAYTAYHFLLSKVRAAIETEISRLRSMVRRKRTDSSQPVGSCSRNNNQGLVHGMISLQRDWFLHHGAHQNRKTRLRVCGSEGVSTNSI